MSTMSNLGDLAEKLALLNIEIWHEVTKIKNISGQLYDKPSLPVKDRITCAFKIRELNAERSAVRWEIDKIFGGGSNETKIFSKEQK